MRKTALVVVVMLLALGFTGPSLWPQPARAAGRTWTVLVGGGVPGAAVVANAFSPRTIEIEVGDTVTWDFQQPWTVHTVTFLSGEQVPPPIVEERGKPYHNPRIFFPSGGKTYGGTGYVNSGVPPDLSKPFSYSLKFIKVGTFRYVCLLHAPPMAGTVIVRPQGNVSTSPSKIAAKGRADLAAILKAGQAAFAKLIPETKAGQVVVPMVGDHRVGWTILRFTREPLVIPSGTTVTWEMADHAEIHTVTFTSGTAPPQFVVPEPQPQGPPKLLLPPEVAVATERKTYDGTGYINSGILFPPDAPGNLPKRFSLTFTKPGRYAYYCVVHIPQGMVGTVIVE